jgi:hypothetical protein
MTNTNTNANDEGDWEDVGSAELDEAAGGQRREVPRRYQAYLRSSYQRNGAIWGGLAGLRTGAPIRGARAGWRAGGELYDRVHGPIRD